MKRELPVVLLASSLALFGALIHLEHGFYHLDRGGAVIGTDDAFISFRYASNLLKHGELTFNLGQKVEGFSNLLFTLGLTAIARVAHTDNFYLLSLIANLTGIVLLLATCRKIAGLLILERANLLVLLIGITPNFWLWIGSGLESIWVVTLQMCLLCSACSVMRETQRSSAVLVLVTILLVFLRPDGFITPLSVGGYLYLQGQRRHGA